jgi:hypothetical protein
MSTEERKLLIELAEELPNLRSQLDPRLEAETRYLETDRAIRAAQYKRWRALEADADILRRARSRWLSIVVGMMSILALFGLGWLTVGGNFGL